MEWRKLKIALFATTYMLAIVWLVFFVQSQFANRLGELGIMPREWKSVANFLLSPLLHASLGHLVNNSIAFFALSLTCFYFYGGIAMGVILAGVCSGVLVWMFGRDYYHIGLSGVCYCLSMFLFISGIVRKNVSLLTISLLVIFWQGSLIWGMIPSLNEPLNISWEGHLAGAAAGFLMAFAYRKRGPANDPEPYDEQEDESDGDELIAEEGWEESSENQDKL